MLLAGGPDVDLAQLRPRRGGQPPGALEGARGGAEARHGDGEDARPGQAEQVEGAGADEEGERRVEAAREAEDDPLHPDVLEPPREAGGLDREDLAAALVERSRGRRARTGAGRPRRTRRCGCGAGTGASGDRR